MAGSSNFLVFNPIDTSNTDSDIEYLSETQRIGGLQNGIAKTAMHNKFYRQVSVMAAALAQFMANQDQIVSDADLSSLITVITNTFATKQDIKKQLSQLNGEWDAEDLTIVSGVLTPDALCWKGKNVQYTQPSAGSALATIASISYDKLRFGHYSVGFRLKCSNITSVNAVTTIKVLTAAGTAVASLQVLGTDFSVVGANVYKTFYVPFDNTGQSTGNKFTFAFTSEPVAGATVAVDSILVAPIHLANFG